MPRFSENGLPRTSEGRASLALRMIAQAQHDSRLLDTKVFEVLFEGKVGVRVLARVNERLSSDPTLASVALSADLSAYLDSSTLDAAKRAQADNPQPLLFPWLEAA